MWSEKTILYFLRTLIMVNNIVSSFPIIKYIINWMSQVLIPTLMPYPLNLWGKRSCKIRMQNWMNLQLVYKTEMEPLNYIHTFVKSLLRSWFSNFMAALCFLLRTWFLMGLFDPELTSAPSIGNLNSIVDEPQFGLTKARTLIIYTLNCPTFPSH